VVRATPSGLSPAVREDWSELGLSAHHLRFDPAIVADEPEPLRRWLGHVLCRESVLATAVEVRMHGRIRLGSWRRFKARQRLSLRDGFVWAATTRVLGLPIVGFDRYTHDRGEMRWKLLGTFPVRRDRGADVTRSEAGRHAGEVLLVNPVAAVDPTITWTAVDSQRVRAAVSVGQRLQGVTLTIGDDGNLRELVMRRWRADGTPAVEQTFGATVGRPRTFGGQTVPTDVSAGWFYGTRHWREGKFIEYRVDDVRPLGDDATDELVLDDDTPDGVPVADEPPRPSKRRRSWAIAANL
jgi:hypothetical protein